MQHHRAAVTCEFGIRRLMDDMMASEKRCSGPCKQTKSVTEFGKNQSKTDKLQSWCKDCMRLNTRVNQDWATSQAPFTWDQYVKMGEAQGWACAICGIV